MQKTSTFIASVIVTVLSLPQAHSASSDWHHAEGGSIRVVTSGAPDDAGVLRGALEIKLRPGWKTYWQDPGDSGVPPTLAITAGSEEGEIDLDFPQPRRFDDGYALWAGYDRPVAIALTFRLPSAPITRPIELSAFLGVCESICVPVQAQFTLDINADMNDPEHAAIVASAFAELPGPSRPGFEARAAGIEGDALLVEATLPENVDAVDLFLASTDTIALGAPERRGDGDGAAFAVPILDRTDGKVGGRVPYTLVTSAGAITGHLELP